MGNFSYVYIKQSSFLKWKSANIRLLLTAKYQKLLSRWAYFRHDNLYITAVKIKSLLFLSKALSCHECTQSEQTVTETLPFSSLVFRRSSGSMCTSCRISGRRVTTPVPRGRMSLPTRLSKTELFPLLCRQYRQVYKQNIKSQECGMHDSLTDDSQQRWLD